MTLCQRKAVSELLSLTCSSEDELGTPHSDPRSEAGSALLSLTCGSEPLSVLPLLPAAFMIGLSCCAPVCTTKQY